VVVVYPCIASDLEYSILTRGDLCVMVDAVHPRTLRTQTPGCEKCVAGRRRELISLARPIRDCCIGVWRCVLSHERPSGGRQTRRIRSQGQQRT
jgi:hypothetical protein